MRRGGPVGPDRHVATRLVARSALDYPSGIVNRLTGVTVIVASLELGLVALWFAAGSGRQRRSYFWARVLLAALALPAFVATLVGVARLHVLALSDDAATTLWPFLLFLGVIILMLVPGVLYRRSDPSPGPSEPDGGGGPGPGQPGLSPDAPRGGIPLPDADQASSRARDHNRPKFQHLKQRRRAPDPPRTPVR